MKIILFFLLIANVFSAQSHISSAEKNALLNLYQSTNGDNWSESWDLTKEPKDWYGITIKNGTVSEIKLRGNALKGNFPAILSVFSNLEVLDLSNNNISGEVSASVSSLSKLISFSINDNFLSGDPTHILSSQNLLQELSIGHNQFIFNDINDLLQNFTSVKVLDISGLNLTSVPQQISKFASLEILDLSDNQLKTGFNNLSALTSLQSLNLAGNELSILPTQLADLPQLTTLNLSRNVLGLNYESKLNNLINLEWLSLENNQLKDLPVNINRFQKLIHLNLGRNQISGNLSALANLNNLEQIFLDHNLLADAFPIELLQLKKLQMLSLSGNNLEGALPDVLPALTFVDDNRFTLTQIKKYLDKKPKNADFIYSPQRYDKALSKSGAIGENITLQQSLTGNDYQFTWFKNLDIKQAGNLEQYFINDLKEEDFTDYTCEAYFAKNYADYFLEVSFFREPITLESTLATKEITKDLTIYPNPTSDLLYVQATNQKVERVTIYETSGKQIFTDNGPNKLRINVKNFPSGAYLIVIKTNAGSKTYKFIKL